MFAKIKLKIYNAEFDFYGKLAMNYLQKARAAVGNNDQWEHWDKKVKHCIKKRGELLNKIQKVMGLSI